MKGKKSETKSRTSLRKAWAKFGPDFLAEAVLSTLKSEADSPVFEWMEDQKFTTEGNVFRVSQTPYLREPMEAYRNNLVKTLVVVAPAQSGKTTMSEGCIAYAIAEMGGNLIFYGPSNDDTVDFCDTRMENHYKKLPRLVRLVHPEAAKNKRQLKIHINGSWFSALSAHNRKKLQSRTAKRVHGDEAASWPEGHAEEARARTTRFDKTSSKHLFCSTPEEMYLAQKMGDEQSPTEFYSLFLSGTQKEWGVTCPKCKEWTNLGLASFDWSGADGEPPKDDDGKWNFGEVKKNLRWKCSNPLCDCEMKDTPKTRAHFTENGSYRAENPEAATVEGERYCESYHYTGFAVPWKSWYGIVEKFLKAQTLQLRGNFLPLKEVIRKQLGEFWQGGQHRAKSLMQTGGYSGSMDGKNRFWISDSWTETGTGQNGTPLRFLTVDVQKDHFWVLSREWGKSGNSRLRLCGRVDTWEEIKEIQELLEIPPSSVLVDSGWRRYGANTKEHEVYRVCFDNGWFALKGDDKPSWPWPSPKGEKPYQRPFSMPDWRDGGQGTKGDGKRRSRRKFFMMYSNPTLKDHLHLLKTGESDCVFGVGANVPNDYLEHMEGETKSPDTGRWERIGENHLWDCEMMMLVAAYLFGLFG